MTAVRADFAGLKASAMARLVGAVPMLAEYRRHKSVKVLATLIALSEADLSASPVGERLASKLRMRPAPDRDRLALAFIRDAHVAIEAPIRTPKGYPTFDAGAWVEPKDFLDLVLKLSQAGAQKEDFDNLVDLVGPVIKSLSDRVAALARAHLQAIVRRDLAYVPQPCLALTPTMSWALAPELEGHPNRAIALLRRRQALELYGALKFLLQEPAITHVIDTGAPLIPALTQRLGITAAHLRRLHRASPLTASLAAHRDCAAAIRELKAHAIPMAEWPNGQDWETSPWVTTYGAALVRPDYSDGSVEVRDALAAFQQDVLQPIAAERAAQLNIDKAASITRFLHSLTVPDALADSAERRCFLSGVAKALLGRRHVRSFRDAVTLWHRRAACIAALRHEQAADRPGWPPCCEAWRSDDGRFEIVALSSAQDLVDEGNALSHCVGGYYDACRSGSTQILSLRETGKRAATIELILTEGGQRLHIAVGQFKSHANSRPQPQHFEALRLFVADLKAGHHAIDQAALIRHRRAMRQSSDYVWHQGPLPLSHAERAWPLYRALVPRGAPETLREWIEQSDLAASLDPILRAISDRTDSLKGPRHESL